MAMSIKCEAKISNQVHEEEQVRVIKEKMKKCHQLTGRITYNPYMN